MIFVTNILEKKWVNEYLIARWIYKQYIKAKENLLSWNFAKYNFKEKLPKWSEIYYFRINKQFRALWFIEDDCFYVVKIDNHQ
jgi:hypothetical protein